MEGTKPWFLSKGVLGGIVTLIALASSFFGWGVTEGEISEAVAMVAAALGTLLSLIGRVVATKKIV